MYVERQAPECKRENGPVQDFDELDLLGRCLGNAPLAQRILQKFRRQLGAEIPQLEQTWRRRDMEALGALAHRLKGSAACAGAHALARTFAGVESMARAAELSSLSAQMEVVECQWRRFENDMARHPPGERLA